MRNLNRYTLWLLLAMCYSVVAYGQDCEQPFVSGFSEYTINSVKVKWLDFGNENPIGYEIELGPKGFTRTGVATSPLINDTEYTYSGLDPATSYDFWLRTVCDTDQSSAWNGPFNFNTNLTNPSPCFIDLEIDNNNCPTTNNYLISVTELPGAQLGVNYTLDKIDLIIEHPWPPDLAISLRSPSGISVALATHKGIGSENYGNIATGDCNNPAIFASDACESIEDASPPYIGSFRPEGNLNDFLDGSNVNGIWQLEICDRASGDLGVLRYAGLNFTEDSCPLPFLTIVNDVQGDQVTLRWDEPINCDGLQLEVGPIGFIPGTQPSIFINCGLQEFIIDDLAPNTEYEYYVRSVCGPNTSAYSCPSFFTTSCDEVTLSSSFDNQELCPSNCNQACIINDIWQNSNNDDHDWIIFKEATPTTFTGPEADYYNFGNYLYIENISEVCSPGTEAVLESQCLQINSNSDDCELQFAYHMSGVDITTLSLDITLDDGDTWENLWITIGDQGPKWNTAYIDISNYNQRSARFRFVAASGDNIFGDIAIDQIDFFGSVLSPSMSYFFDEDQDGFGSPDSILLRCADFIPFGFVTNNRDCNDLDAAINPNSVEIPCNLIDENCNGNEDDPIEINPIQYSVGNVVNESCQGSNDGIINLSISGGQSPYEVKWNNDFTGSSISGLTEGIYFAEISDANGCITQTDFIEVDALFSLNVFLQAKTNASCLGVNDGSLQVAASGGVSPYRYIWDHGVESNIIENLSPGTYNLVVEDNTGCRSKPIKYDILANPEVIAAPNITNARCFGDNNGRIRINAIDGLPPYQYLWSNGDTTNEINQLVAGAYSCTITDQNGCYAELNNILVSEPDQAMILLDNIQQISCPNELDGSIEISIRGGNPPYTYLWNTNQLTDDLFGLSAGFYSVTATDSRACKVIRDSIEIVAPDPIIINIDSIGIVDCPLSEDGFIEVSVTGGSGSYFYFWSEPNSPDSSILENITPDFYGLTVIDQFNCKALKSQIQVNALNEPILLDLSILETNICPNDSSATIAVAASHGNLPIAYNWNAGVQNVSLLYKDTIFNIPAGSYMVTATDHEGCTGVSDSSIIQSVGVYAYTVTEIINNICTYDSFGTISINIEGGTAPLTVDWSNGMSGTTIEGLGNGLYQATITDSENCTLISQNIRVQSTEPITADITTVNQSTSLPNGNILINPNGGTPDYGIIWLDYPEWDDLLFIDNLEAGEYFYSITDMNNCMLEGSVVIDLTNQVDKLNQPMQTLAVFPNPTKDQLFIELNDLKINRDAIIELIDISGKSSIVHPQQTQINDSIKTLKLNVTTFPNGIYKLRISQRGTVHYATIAIVK